MEYGDEQFEEYIHSYNYYIYYLSLKPRDPRLPKPLYKPSPDLDFIKSVGFNDKLDEIVQNVSNKDYKNKIEKEKNYCGFSERMSTQESENSEICESGENLK